MKISIVIPVYNEEKVIKQCLDALINQDYPKNNYEIVVVNDGSTDNTLKAIKRKQVKAKQKGVAVKIVTLDKNQGRAIAREIGTEKAKYNNLLFIDAKCIAKTSVLKNIKKINYQPVIANTVINYNRSSLDRFNHLLRKRLYSPYFGKSFKPVFITKNNFDKIPRGTGIFFCDKKLFLSSRLKCRGENLSDDPKLLWSIVQKRKILKHPKVKVGYLSRTSLLQESKHFFGKGIRFVDFYLAPKRRRFWLLIFFPILMLTFATVLIFLNFTYFFYWIVVLVLLLVFASLWFAENIKDFLIVMELLPVIGLSFELGILKGLFLKLCGKIKPKEL